MRIETNQIIRLRPAGWTKARWFCYQDAARCALERGQKTAEAHRLGLDAANDEYEASREPYDAYGDD